MVYQTTIDAIINLLESSDRRVMVTNVTRQILLVEPMGALDALAHLDGVDLAPINVLLGTIALAVRTPLATFDMFTKTLRGAEGILAAGRTGTL